MVLDSYTVIARYPIKMSSWYFRPGIHHAFRPTPAEAEAMEANSNLVTDNLIAMGVDGKYSEIHLFNPTFIREEPPPEPITELRYESEAESRGGEGSSDEKGSDGGDAVQKAGKGVNAEDEGGKKKVETVTGGIKQIRLTFSGPAPPKEQELPEETPPKKPRKSDAEVPPKKKYPPLLPWSLSVRDFGTFWRNVRKEVEYVNNFRDRPPIIAKVAISPRGAKWIVGVGEGESVYVWRMRDGSQLVGQGKT